MVLLAGFSKVQTEYGYLGLAVVRMVERSEQRDLGSPNGGVASNPTPDRGCITKTNLSPFNCAFSCVTTVSIKHHNLRLRVF